jgi:hypothetical protein
VNKIIVMFIGICFLVIFLYLEISKISVPLIISLTPAAVAFFLYFNLVVKEKLSFVEIHNQSKRVIYNKTYLFGIFQIQKTLIFSGNEMDDILNFYKNEKFFSIDYINDLVCAKVIFTNN